MIEIAIVIACLFGSVLLTGLRWWMWLVSAICAVVLIFEIKAIIKTGKTLSRMFWEWGKKNRVKACMAIGIFLSGVFVLIFHLIKGIF